MTKPFPVTRLMFVALVLIVRGLWAFPWWVLLIGAIAGMVWL
jgi:hypothetical protein